MTEKTQLENLTHEIAQLTKTVQEHSADKATIDIEKLAGELTGLVDQQVEVKMKEAEAKRPARKGEWFGPEGFQEQSMGLVETPGKFYGQKLSDLAFAHSLLTRAQLLDAKASKGPSEELTKLLDTTVAGEGLELVPRGLAAELWEGAFLASKVVGLLNVIPQPTDPFDMPLGFGDIIWRKGTAGTATSSQDPETDKSVMTSTEQVAELTWGYNLDEDAVIAMLPTLRAEISRSAAEAMDAFVLNADGTNAATGNINLDDDTPAADAYYLSNGQDGIRHYYLRDKTAQSTDINSKLDDEKWLAGRARMGKYGINADQIVAVTNVKTYLLSLLGLSNVRTLDKYGPQATILTGELAKIDGVSVVVSESMPLAEDDGCVSATPGNNDEGQIALIHRPSWRVGFRRQLLIEIDRDIRRRFYFQVASFRQSIAARTRGAGDVGHTAGIHGITY